MPVTLANMRSHGCRDVLIYWGNAPRYWHHGELNVDSWPDDVSFNEIGQRMVYPLRFDRCGGSARSEASDGARPLCHR